jgi:hypothetical protein
MGASRTIGGASLSIALLFGLVITAIDFAPYWMTYGYSYTLQDGTYSTSTDVGYFFACKTVSVPGFFEKRCQSYSADTVKRNEDFSE